MGAHDRTLPESIAGRYRIAGILGEGGMSCVFRAVHEELDKDVAIKVVRPDRESERSLERMRREARSAARLTSPNIVRVLDTGQDAATGRYIVMEFVDGPTLAELLAREGPLAPARAVHLVLQACAGLAAAHAAGIVHRDIKPSNLMVATTEAGAEQIKIADFGIAKTEGMGSLTLTETAAVLGSPKYMSPEQIREAHDVDPRSDLWSLGVVLYEMLTGRLPYEAFTAAGLLARIAADPPVPLRERRPELSAPLGEVVMACLEKDVDRRIPSATELAARLTNLPSEALEVAGASPAVMVTLASAMHADATKSDFVSEAPGPLPVVGERRAWGGATRVGVLVTGVAILAILGLFLARRDARAGDGARERVTISPTVEPAPSPPLDTPAVHEAPLVVPGTTATSSIATTAQASRPTEAVKTKPILTGATGDAQPPSVPSSVPSPSGATVPTFVDFGPRK